MELPSMNLHHSCYLFRATNAHYGALLYYAVVTLLFCSLCDCSNLTDQAGAKLLSSSSHLQNCTETNYVYSTLSSTSEGSSSLRRHASNGLPQSPINGQHLKVCVQGFTCCTEEMETRLIDESRKEFQKSVQDKIVGLSHTFESRTTKFDRFFRELLANARRDLHQMFVRTYGMLYEQNADIFSSLFDDLTSYYVANQKIDLDASVDKFYQQLYKRMFRILNQPYQFETSYWDCMSRHMEELKPFGDVPTKMKQQVTKSFVAARTFVNGLAVGRDVVRQIMELSPSTECTPALMRMMYCPHCRGMVGVKPCKNFCLNVMKGCLAYQTELDQEWNEYLDALLQLLERLEGPFNIESVIDPIDVKISDAIMIFQDRGKEITDQIFAGCGNPKMSKMKKRNLIKDELTLSELKFGNQSPPAVRPTTAAGTSLDRLAKDIREKITHSKGFWRNLPYSVCNDEKVSSSSKPADMECWNGSTKDKYQSDLVGDGVINQLNNPEVSVRPGSSNEGVSNQTAKLKIMSAKLRKAFDGLQVEMTPGATAAPSRMVATVNASRQRDRIEEMSGDGSGDDAESDEERATDSKKGKKPPKMETDDEDLVDPENSGEDFSGAGMKPAEGEVEILASSSTTKMVVTYSSPVPSTSTTTSPTTTTTMLSTTTVAKATSTANIPPDTNWAVDEFDLPEPTVSSTTTTRRIPSTATSRRIAVTVPPLTWSSTSTKPPIYVMFDIKTDKPPGQTSKRPNGQTRTAGAFVYLVLSSTLLSFLSKRLLL